MLTILEVHQMLRNVGITAILLLLPVTPLRAGMEPGNSAPLTVTSPDGNVSISFELKANPQPYLPGERAYYRVSYKGAPVLVDSPLGLDFQDERPLDRDFKVLRTDTESRDESWQNLFGARRAVRNHYNQLAVSLRERTSPGRQVDLIFRAYNEGAAFRYSLPEQEALGRFTLAAENTGFYFAREAYAYALNLGSYTTSYEGDYRRVSLDRIKPGKAAWDWWSGSFARGVNFKPGMNTATMDHYIDFAADHHLEYMLIDEGWSTHEDITHWVAAVDLPEILDKARRRDVRVLLWMHWEAVQKHMAEAFPLYEKWGVAGVKVDFMDRDDQEMVNFYERVVRKAAEH